MSNQLVQYVLLRSDLIKDLGWSVGSLVAQACHASTAVLHLYREDETTVKYLNDLDNMHKVVLEGVDCSPNPANMSNQLVQYVLLRSDLIKDLGWSVGSLVAQACHASTAVLHLYREDETTVKYLNDLDNMHKVVLEVPNEDALKKIAEKLKENAIDHKLWIEQPENIPTCLAMKPYPKDQVKKYVGKFKLYKTTLSSDLVS